MEILNGVFVETFHLLIQKSTKALCLKSFVNFIRSTLYSINKVSCMKIIEFIM